jgi:hypothetical protein
VLLSLVNLKVNGLTNEELSYQEVQSGPKGVVNPIIVDDPQLKREGFFSPSCKVVERMKPG